MSANRSNSADHPFSWSLFLKCNMAFYFGVALVFGKDTIKKSSIRWIGEEVYTPAIIDFLYGWGPFIVITLALMRYGYERALVLLSDEQGDAIVKLLLENSESKEEKQEKQLIYKKLFNGLSALGIPVQKEVLSHGVVIDLVLTLDTQPWVLALSNNQKKPLTADEQQYTDLLNQHGWRVIWLHKNPLMLNLFIEQPHVLIDYVRKQYPESFHPSEHNPSPKLAPVDNKRKKSTDEPPKKPIETKPEKLAKNNHLSSVSVLQVPEIKHPISYASNGQPRTQKSGKALMGKRNKDRDRKPFGSPTPGHKISQLPTNNPAKSFLQRDGEKEKVDKKDSSTASLHTLFQSSQNFVGFSEGRVNNDSYTSVMQRLKDFSTNKSLPDLLAVLAEWDQGLDKSSYTLDQITTVWLSLMTLPSNLEAAHQNNSSFVRLFASIKDKSQKMMKPSGSKPQAKKVEYVVSSPSSELTDLAKTIPLDADAMTQMQLIQNTVGGEVRIYGGTVVDSIFTHLHGKKFHPKRDLDLVVIRSQPMQEEVAAFKTIDFRFVRKIPSGDLYQSESKTSTHRTDVMIKNVSNLYEEALPRDFYMSTLSRGLKGDIQDPTGKGYQQLKDKIIELIIPPGVDPEKAIDDRFKNFPELMLRALYFVAKYDAKIEQKTSEGIERNRDHLSDLDYNHLNDCLGKHCSNGYSHDYLSTFLQLHYDRVLFPPIYAKSFKEIAHAKQWMLFAVDARCENPVSDYRLLFVVKEVYVLNPAQCDLKTEVLKVIERYKLRVEDKEMDTFMDNVRHQVARCVIFNPPRPVAAGRNAAASLFEVSAQFPVVASRKANNCTA